MAPAIVPLFWVWPVVAAGFYAVLGRWQLAQGWRVLGIASLATAGVWGLQAPVILWMRRRRVSQSKAEGTSETGRRGSAGP
jgi:hypothetical protein